MDQKILNQCWRLISHIQSKTLQATNLSISNTVIVQIANVVCVTLQKDPEGRIRATPAICLNFPTGAFLWQLPSDPVGTEGEAKPEQFWCFWCLYMHCTEDVTLSVAFSCPIQPSTDDLKKKIISAFHPLCLVQDCMDFIGNLKSE